MQTKRPEQVPTEERYKILESYWKHDLYYESRLVGERVSAVIPQIALEANIYDNQAGHVLKIEVT